MGIESERAPFDNSGPPYTLDGMDPVLRDLIVCAVHGAMAMEKPPREGHWLMSSWQLGRAALPAQPDLLAALKLAYEAMEYMIDAVTDEEFSRVKPAFDAVRAALRATPTGAAPT